jgi:hypothetical protein
MRMGAGDRAPRCGARCTAVGRRSSGRHEASTVGSGKEWRRTGSPAVAPRADLSCVEGTIPEPLDRPESSPARALDAREKFPPPENGPGRPFRGGAGGRNRAAAGTLAVALATPARARSGGGDRSVRPRAPGEAPPSQAASKPVPFPSRVPLDLSTRAAGHRDPPERGDARPRRGGGNGSPASRYVYRIPPPCDGRDAGNSSRSGPLLDPSRTDRARFWTSSRGPPGCRD